MKSFKINRFVVIVLLLFLVCSAYASSSGCRVLQIWVDGQNRVYWCICNPADDLPHLIPPKSNISDSLGYKIDMRELYNLILEKIEAISHLNIIISIHPDAHYSGMDRILKAIHWVEWVWRDKVAYDSPNNQNESSRKQNYFQGYMIRYWEKRDNRILEGAWKERNIIPAKQTNILFEQTYEFKLKNGYWDNKIPEIVGPSMAKPKIRIFKPVSDEEIIDDDVMIASRDNLAEIIARKEKEATAVSETKDEVDINKMLPGPNEFVPVEITAEQVYYHEPNYPRLAQTANMEAVVWVKVLVDKDGKVRDAMILKSSGSRAGFDEAAAQAAYKCRYKPAIQNGRPVAVWVSYKVEFIISDK